MPAYTAEILTVAFGFPLAVVTVNDCDVAPAGTTTPAVTDASEGIELVNVTSAPPIGAGAANVTVPDDVVPPTTMVGLNRKATSAGGGDVVTVNVVVFVAPL